MKIIIEIDTENDAFESEPDREIKRLCSEVVERIGRGAQRGLLRDINGNLVGEWEAEK